MSGEEKERIGLTPRALLVGLVFVVFFTWYYGLRTIDCANLGIYGGIAGRFYLNNQVGTTFTQAMGLAVLVSLILAAINKVKPIFSAQEIAVIVLMVPLSNIWAGSMVGLTCVRPYNYLAVSISYLVEDYPEYADLIPSFFGPIDVDFWENLTSSSTSIPFDVLGGLMGYVILVAIASAFTAFFLAHLFRRLYVEIERLENPFSIMFSELVKGIGVGNGKIFRNKLFVIALVLGYVHFFFAWTVGWIPALVTGDPNARFVNRGYVPIGGLILNLWPQFDLTRYGLLPWIPLYISLLPYEVGWGLLTSIDALNGFLLGWIILWVLWPSIEVAMGRYPAFSAGVSNSSVFDRIWYGDPDGITPVALCIGVALALGFLTVIRNRRAIGHAFTSLFRKPPSEFEAESPISYRLIWIAFIVFLIIWIAVGAVLNIDLSLLTLYTIFCILIMIGCTRMIAETGGYLLCGFPSAWKCFWYDFVGQSIYYLFGSWGTLNMTVYWTYNILANRGGLYHTYMWLPTIVMYYTICSYQVARTVRVDKKSIFKALLITLPVVIVVSVISFWFWVAYLPINPPGTLESTGSISSTVSNIQSQAFPYFGMRPYYNLGTNVALIVVGIILGYAIMFLRARVPAFRVSLAGMLFGMLFGISWWATYLLAYIVKVLAIRIGGVRLFEEKIKPIAIGLAAGGLLGVSIFHIIGFIIHVQNAFITGTFDLY